MLGSIAGGKGSQSKRITGERGVHISSGALARQKVENDEIFREMYGGKLVAGEYLPDKIVFELVQEVIPTIGDNRGVIVGDGIVRNFVQAKRVDNFFARPNLLIGFNIKVPREVTLVRSFDRAKKERRADDFSEDTIIRRCRAWEQNEESVLRKLRAKGVKIFEINGNRHADNVHAEIDQHLTRHISGLRQQWEQSRSHSQPKRRRPRVAGPPPAEVQPLQPNDR
jgi:adenylate kinase family enzyme